MAMMKRGEQAGQKLQLTRPEGLGIDRWLHQTLRASWDAVMAESLPADLLRILEDQSHIQQR